MCAHAAVCVMYIAINLFFFCNVECISTFNYFIELHFCVCVGGGVEAVCTLLAQMSLVVLACGSLHVCTVNTQALVWTCLCHV